LRSKKFTWKCW